MSERSVAEILACIEAEASQQLTSARRLDVPGLDASTRRRQDLLFELQLAVQDDPAFGQTDEAHATVERLQRLDDRLARICASVLALITPADQAAAPGLYGADGRLNG